MVGKTGGLLDLLPASLAPDSVRDMVSKGRKQRVMEQDILV